MRMDSAQAPTCWQPAGGPGNVNVVENLFWVSHGMATLRQANTGNGVKIYSLHLIFTFCLDRDTSVLKLFPVFFLININKISRRSVFYQFTVNRNHFQNWWIPWGRSKMTIISIHTIANQNSYHDDKSTFLCLTWVSCAQPIRNVRTRQHIDNSSIISHQVNFDIQRERLL